MFKYILLLCIILDVKYNYAATDTYNSTQDGDWMLSSTWADWPTPTDDVQTQTIFNISHSVTMSTLLHFGNKVTVNILTGGSLLLDAGLTTGNNDLNINISSGASFILNGTLSLNNKLTIDITNGGSADINGDITVLNNSDIQVDGILDVSGSISGNNNNDLTGTGTVNVGGSVGGFTVAGGLTVNENLPVDLIYFNGKKETGNIHIIWVTASETNNDFFLVERSSDAKNWHVIAKIEGAGTTSTQKSYSHYDEPANNGIFYYRLQQVDYNGHTTCYKPICINFSNYSNKLKIYPTITSDKIHINQSGNIEIKNINYQTVLDIYINEKNSIIMLPKLSTGIYYVSVKNGNETFTSRFVFNQLK